MWSRVWVQFSLFLSLSIFCLFSALMTIWNWCKLLNTLNIWISFRPLKPKRLSRIFAQCVINTFSAVKCLSFSSILLYVGIFIQREDWRRARGSVQGGRCGPDYLKSSDLRTPCDPRADLRSSWWTRSWCLSTFVSAVVWKCLNWAIWLSSTTALLGGFALRHFKQNP